MKVRLADICTITSSRRIFKREYVKAGVPFVRGQEVSNGDLLKEDTKFECYITKQRYKELKKNNIIPKKGDILITAVGTVGNLCYINRDIEFYFKDGNLILLTDFKKNVCSEYLYYLMKSDLFKRQLQYTMIGAVQKALTIDMLSNIEIDLPVYEKQIKITRTLSNMDKKIEKNNKINKELEKIIRTIYNYWFLQFEFPNKKGKPYKSCGGEMLYNESLNRKIPKNWKSGTFLDFIKEEKSGDWGKESQIGNYTMKVNCIRGADFPAINSDEILKSPVRFINKKNSNKILEDGNIIIEISGGSPIQSTGRITYINESVLERFENPIITSNFCKALELKNRKYMYWFYMTWKSIYESDILFNYEGKTTGIKNFLFDSFCLQYKVTIPSEREIEMFNNLAEKIFTKIQKNKLENQELIKLRDYLLPLLMNGQIKL